MNEFTIRALAACEYDFIALMADTDNLAQRLNSVPLPEAANAAEQLYKVKTHLMAILKRLDGPLSEAVAAVEQLEPAPF